MTNAPTNTPAPLLVLEQVSMQFAAQPVLRGLDLGVGRGQTLVVIGESGCGKTVLLKIMVALLRPTLGRVYFDGQDWTKLTDRDLAKQRLRFGYLFQGSALFDSLTVAENIAFGLRAQGGRPDKEIQEVVRQR